MTPAVATATTAVRAHATGSAPSAVAQLIAELTHGLAGRPAVAVLYFASSRYLPTDLAGPIAAAFPAAAVIGCSTAGEFTDAAIGTGAVSAIAFPHGMFAGALAALGDLSVDVAAGTQDAVRALESRLGRPLRSLDPTRHVALMLVDGVHGCEERVTETLGNAAPLLEFVGGSAGDDLAFHRTWVTVGDKVSYRGVALLIAAAARPFQAVKTCSFATTGRTLEITEADPGGRVVRRIDGRPAAEAYASAIGVPVAALESSVWMRHPLGLMIGGEPWIRSPQAITPDGGLRFYAELRAGTRVEVMTAGDLVADTRAALARTQAELGGHISGALLFNCVLRRLEMDETRVSQDFLAALAGIPTAGFHTYGETWLGHVNQTLTGLLFA